MAVGKVKRVSKKTKKSWRKNVDVRDVDDFLENQRLEERLGGAFRERKDEDLFAIDTKGGEEVGDVETLPTRIEVRKSLRFRDLETPKCFSLLERRSAVADPVGRRTKVKSVEERRHPLALKRLQRKKESGVLTEKEKEAIKNREVQAARKAKEEEKKEFNRNIWQTAEPGPNDLSNHAEWLTKDTVRHNLHNTGQRRKRIPVPILKKTSTVAAVEVPHPGASYNPSIKDHKELLQLVVEKEAEVFKQEKHIERVTTKMFSKAKREDVERDWMTEMSVGLKADSDASEVEGDYTTVNPPVKNKKKTLKKRRKLREALALKEQLHLAKIEKRKRADLHRLNQFEDSIQKKQAREMKTAEKRQLAKVEKVKKTKLLSQTRYKEPELEFSMLAELKGNLRGLEQQGNLLADRFKSMQKRNILAPSLKRKVKARPAKRYEKPNAKMGWEPKGY